MSRRVTPGGVNLQREQTSNTTKIVRVVAIVVPFVLVAYFALFAPLLRDPAAEYKGVAPPLNRQQDLYVGANENPNEVLRQQQQQQHALQKQQKPQHQPADDKAALEKPPVETPAPAQPPAIHTEAAAVATSHHDDHHEHEHDDDHLHAAHKNNNPGNPRAVLVKAVRSAETDPVLIELNKPYHALRKKIREAGPKNAHRVHIFFTMDCTDHSAWQVGTLEHSWEKVGQEGVLTRIISGCESYVNSEDRLLRAKLEHTKRHFLSSDEIAANRRGSFYAPYASTLPSGRHYAPYNRPHSVYYWLKHADLTEEVFVMLDPDMVFLAKLPTESVRLGAPVSQVYEYMEQTEFESYRCESCPKTKFDRRPYAVGPPWMMHLSDWIRVTPRWIKICQELAEAYPTNWIVEMIAYSIACKVEELPHSTTYRAMVDNVDDAIVWNERTDELGFPTSGNNANSLLSAEQRKNDPLIPPSTLHYCYTIELGEVNPPESAKFEQHRRHMNDDAQLDHPVLDWYHFSKYRVPTDWPGGKARYGKNFMDCSAPLLQEFHSLGRVMHTVFGDDGWGSPHKDGRSPGDGKVVPAKFRSTWRRAAKMLELLIPAINAAMTQYKSRYCAPETINLKRLIRTTHPSFYTSRWELDNWDAAGNNVSFHNVEN